ncbi:MAG: HD domain-containing phosphohydrolase [Planctomycetota bacterium]
MTSLVEEATGTYTPVALDGLVGGEPLEFPLFLRSSTGLPVLYRDERTVLTDVHLARLQTEGVQALYVREQDLSAYHRRVERELDRLLRNAAVPLEHRVGVLCGVAGQVAQDLLEGPPSRAQVQRAQRMLAATSALVLRDKKAFSAVRSVLQARPDLAHHSMVTSFVTLGLARQVVGSDPVVLTHAGLAGLLHDVGRVGHEDDVEDEEHVRRGLDRLATADLPRPVLDAVLCHHERLDGSGFPRGLRGPSIPLLARMLGLVDTFATIYAEQKPRVGVFDALRIIAEVYRGCFDEQIAVALVHQFR